MKSVEKPIFIIGIDEAGRGPLAGPVSIGIVKTTPEFFTLKEVKVLLKNLAGKDSKKLSHDKRDQWFTQIKQWKKDKLIDVHVSLISHDVIDTQGISQAIKLGIKECLRKVKAEPQITKILLDGSLKAPEEFKNQKTIIKGDEKELVIGLASIAAKVTRDRAMFKIAHEHPQYGFDIHKGYGTLVHRQAIMKHGPSQIHRLSFLKNFTNKP